MKIGILIPDRNDRPKFLEHSLLMLKQQTVKADFVEVVNFESTLKTDLTLRCKLGIQSLKNKGADVIFFWENDDYYSPIYLEVFLSYWNASNEPKLFGLDNTIYYSLKSLEYTKMIHKNRASLFSTMITKDLDIDYPNDDEVFLDIYLWNKYKGETFNTINPICLGIKHGIGNCGGKAHGDRFNYNNSDSNFEYLKEITQDSFKFYEQVHTQIISNLP